jgi:hypothetical protein
VEEDVKSVRSTTSS